MAASNARALAIQVQATPPDAPAGCAPARARLASAAGELETLANAAKRFFEAPGPDGISSVERAADVYISAQAALTNAVNACFPS
jgi:hypothetical protein